MPQVDFEKVKSLFNEYEIVRSLNHPNIVKAFGFYTGDDGIHPPSILLEYFSHTLANSVEQLDDIELVLIIYEICSVMNHIHKNASMIHRDLKPENILLDSKKHVKLCDFGTAKLIDIESQTNSSMTHRVGSLPYMAPELLNDSGNYDRKVDVYAFGVILYFIIAKTRPKISTIDVMAGKKAEIPPTFTKFAKKLILKCWSYLPNDRPEFEEIINMIIKNNFMLFNGINDDQIIDLRKKLNLT